MTNWYYEMIVRHEDLACEVEEQYRRQCEEKALIDSIIAEVWDDSISDEEYEEEGSTLYELMDDEDLFDGDNWF